MISEYPINGRLLFCVLESIFLTSLCHLYGVLSTPTVLFLAISPIGLSMAATCFYWFSPSANNEIKFSNIRIDQQTFLTTFLFSFYFLCSIAAAVFLEPLRFTLIYFSLDLIRKSTKRFDMKFSVLAIFVVAIMFLASSFKLLMVDLIGISIFFASYIVELILTRHFLKRDNIEAILVSMASISSVLFIFYFLNILISGSIFNIVSIPKKSAFVLVCASAAIGICVSSFVVNSGFRRKDTNSKMVLSATLIHFAMYIFLGIGDLDSFGAKIFFIIFWIAFLYLLTIREQNIFRQNLLPLNSDRQFSPVQFTDNNENFQRHFNAFKALINDDLKAQRIFIFLVLNFAFMFVELFYGLATNSLGLVSDSCHMLFDCIAMVIGLYSTYAASLKQDSLHTFGYARIKVLSGFINSIFLLFIAFSILSEAFERLFNPPNIDSHLLVSTSVAGLLVNLIGIFFFSDTHAGHDHHNLNHSRHQNSEKIDCNNEVEEDMNMKGLFLHVVADTLGSVGVIISSLLIKYFEWSLADSICSIIISSLILIAGWPLFAESSRVLLQNLPENSAPKIEKNLDGLKKLGFVTGFRKPLFWELVPGTIVGSVNVLVSENENGNKEIFTNGKKSDEMSKSKSFSELETNKMKKEIWEVLKSIKGLKELTVQIETLSFAKNFGIKMSDYVIF